MNLEIGFTEELTNTAFAPLVVLSALYQSQHRLDPLRQVPIQMRERDFSLADKLIQVLVSMLAGCTTLAEVNPHLKPERAFASVWGWDHFADQSSLSRTLDALSLKQLEQLRASVGDICRPLSQIPGRDWRSYLWLDFDLTGLPCGPLAELSQKGYFSDKKSARSAARPGQCRGLSRNPLVGVVPRQLSQRAMFPARRAGHRNCFRLIRSATQTSGLAHGWRGRQR
jgi:hypothetical protein